MFTICLWGEQTYRKHFDLGRCSILNANIYIVYSPFGDSENRGTNLLNEFTFRHTELAISDAIIDGITLQKSENIFKHCGYIQ